MANERSIDDWTATGDWSATRGGCRSGSCTWSGNGPRIGARRRSGHEGVPDGPREPDDVVVGRAGGRRREGVARADGRAVPQEAPERDDQDGAPVDERARACVQGGGCGEERPRP